MSHDLRYALVMLAAIVVMSVLLRRWQARLPLAGWQKLALGLGGFCGAMIGAKLPFALADWSGLLSGGAWLADGKTILCGIVGGYFGVELTKWTLDITIKTGDTFAVPVAVGVAIGRVAASSAAAAMARQQAFPLALPSPTAETHFPAIPRSSMKRPSTSRSPVYCFGFSAAAGSTSSSSSSTYWPI